MAVSREKEVSEMRMKTFNVLRTAGKWIEKILEVRLPMDIVAGVPHRQREDL
jgi:hypothetical protein